MHLLYIDESGSVADPNQHFFVLAGVSVFERKTHWVEQKLNSIAAQFNPSDPWDIELHGSPMRSGRDGWKQHKLSDRLQAMDAILQQGVADEFGAGVRLFGAVVNKANLAGIDPVEHAFEQLTSRFDLFLKRLYSKHNDPQRGLMLLDKSSTEQRIQNLAREFKYRGHSWGTTKNYAEVPVFLDSKASRLIQLADMVAFALFRFYEHNDDRFYNIIKGCFDREGDVEHGLYVRG
ncbi:MAG: N-acetylglucosamine-6-phosphate deacetylase [Gammaproteobacteria bacterium 28-57-27]|nr:MAG: N-acetylglucosamine-6-phosphate deacetylase [Gammaproteobacteria bacterium 28-57-27]